MKIFSLIKHAFFKLKVYRANPYTLPDLYRTHYGMKIGENCVFTGKRIAFGSEPYLIEIGNKVRITADVKFETHDGGVGIFRDEYPGINVFGKIKVGDNTFIGHGSIVMPGVTIGENVVIGAGSIVTKDISSNSIAVGIPAKVIKSTDEYKSDVLKKALFLKTLDPEQRKIEILEHLQND
jgi:acetyltransferase-like isoleucine patch superfamily enzyme